mgnify:CR=1 FL=1
MEEERDIVVFADDEGNEFELDVIDYFEYEGQEYAILMDLSDLPDPAPEQEEECECTDGCPSCVQSPKCGSNNEPLDKAGAAYVLREMLSQAANKTPPGVHAPDAPPTPTCANDPFASE